MKKLTGAGGGPSTPTQTSDNLFSTDIVEALLGVSEGPIKGLKDGPKSFLIGDTPLKNVDNQNNFDSFELVIRKGSELGEDITSRMGGFASSTNVGVNLASDVPVVRQGLHTEIDYIDIRLVINQLFITNEEGNFEHTGKVKIEYKKTGSPTWLPVQTDTLDPPPPTQTGPTTDIYTELSNADLSSGSPGDRTTYIQNDAPPTTASVEQIWFDSNDNWKPYRLASHAWGVFPGATYTSTGGANYWSWTERSAWGTNRVTKAFIRLSTDPKPTDRFQGDYLVHTDTNQTFFYNGSAWIIAGSSLAPGRFGGNGTGGSVTVSAGEITIKGKTSTSFVKEFRFPVDNIAGDTYQLRVTKTSPENTTEKFFDVSWESFQEVVAKTFNFPALATSQLTARSSDQFSSIPEFSGIYQGRIIKVPTNYDPVARTYTGVWDGLWKLEYTNNPAFIVNDLVENDRYGLNAYYPVVLNKYDVYDAGVWCDTRTDDDVPRFTFNGLIQEPRGCREAIDYICGTFGGRFFDDGNGSASIRIDNDSSPTGLFTPENVVEGRFTYSFTEISGRHNDITVTFINPALNYKEDRRRIFNQNHIDRYGRIPLNFIAVGCNSSPEAIVRGRYKLATGTSEVTMVNFQTNRQGMYHQPYDIILISDEDMNAGITGRIQAKEEQNWYWTSFGSIRGFHLRDPIYLEPGFDYKVLFQIPNGESFQTIEYAITPGLSGEVSTITLESELSPLVGIDTVFSIVTITGETAPRPFRITNISEIDDDPDHVEVQAIQVNRLKWDFIDGVIEDYEDPEVYDMDIGGKPRPVPIVRVSSYINLNGGVQTYNILLDWDPSPSKTVSHYKVLMSKDNGPHTLLSDSPSINYEITNLQPGEYLFSVIAVSDVSAIPDSLPTVIEHRLIGDLPDPTAVSNLRLVQEVSTSTYARRDPTFAWDPVTVPEHHHYQVRIYDTLDNVVAEYPTILTTFTYDYLLNQTDHGGTAAREFKFGIASQDQFGSNSEFTTLVVNNPQPNAPTLSITPGVASATFAWPVSQVLDYAGAKIWVSTTAGFTPNDGTNLIYDGSNSSYTFMGASNETYYVRFGLYDTFGKSGMVVSSEYSFTTGDIASAIGEEFASIPGYLYGDGQGTLSDQFERFLDMIADLANQSVSSQAVSQQRRLELQAEVDESRAYFLEQITVVADEVSALSSDVTALEASTGAADAAIISDLSALTTTVSSQATSITNLGAQYNDVSATGLVSFKVAATPAGATARYAIVLRTVAGGSTTESGFYLDNLTGGGTRAAVKADQFVLLNSSAASLGSPFYVSGGSAYINNAYITNLTASNINVATLSAISANLGTITGGTITLGGGKLVLDGPNSRIIVAD